MGVGGQRYAPAALPPGKRPRTHFTGPLLLLGAVMMDGNRRWGGGCEGKFLAECNDKMWVVSKFSLAPLFDDG
jgi:hypothetical protein